jgi:hypothetical protein
MSLTPHSKQTRMNVRSTSDSTRLATIERYTPSGLRHREPVGVCCAFE